MRERERERAKEGWEVGCAVGVVWCVRGGGRCMWDPIVTLCPPPLPLTPKRRARPLSDCGGGRGREEAAPTHTRYVIVQPSKNPEQSNTWSNAWPVRVVTDGATAGSRPPVELMRWFTPSMISGKTGGRAGGQTGSQKARRGTCMSSSIRWFSSLTRACSTRSRSSSSTRAATPCSGSPSTVAARPTFPPTATRSHGTCSKRA